MRLIGRLFVIFFAFVAACMAAGMVIAYGLLGYQWHFFDADPVERGVFWVTSAFGSSFAGAAAFLPAVLLAMLTEAFRLRSILFYALAGVVIALLAYYGSGIGNPYEESIDHAGPITRGVEITLAAGIVFGLVYWLIAGRKAGAWRDPRAP